MILLRLVSEGCFCLGGIVPFSGLEPLALSQGCGCRYSNHAHNPGVRESWSTLWVTATAGCWASC